MNTTEATEERKKYIKDLEVELSEFEALKLIRNLEPEQEKRIFEIKYILTKLKN